MATATRHVMLSYQWDRQELVKRVFKGLKVRGINVWMDIEGGMSGDINESMAKGVDGAACVCCFMTNKYQDSKNCKRELTYADSQEKTIIPAMTEPSWKATGWLGIITAGLLWIDFRNESNLDTRIDSLAKEIVHAGGNAVQSAISPESAAPVTHAKPGRAFRHKLTGKYLAESGQVKFHPASGERSTLVLRDRPESTSYWVEERKSKGDGCYFYKNYASNGYLGYDPNGDYTYTKGQHYGAEEWSVAADTQSSSGEREVVLFALFGKKFLAIRNGKFTGVSTRSDDCVWVLE
ncbi:uncharacterized protein LOC141908741 [Tubulanus polymorphus]|uniref:uncharacterized protein LOC141908741 n=1 Tax=Tubulanus polymorphus TaxID=672921 RepID=UPI003DA49AD8